jgi:outer membrane protein assembly factor BamB
MRPAMKMIAFVGLLLTVAGISGSLLALEPGQWPGRYRDAGNASSTTVNLYDPPGDTLNTLWEAPDPRDGYLPSFPPLVDCFEDTTGQWVQMVVAGMREEGKILDAWTGQYLPLPANFPSFGWPHYTPGYAGPEEEWYAIDAQTHVFLALQAGDGVEHQVVAYDLRAWQPLWTRQVTLANMVIDYVTRITAKNGVVYLIGRDSTSGNALGVVALDEVEGTVEWEISIPEFSSGVRLPAVGKPDGEDEDWVFLSSPGTTDGGLIAVGPDPDNPGEGKWVTLVGNSDGRTLAAPTIDEEGGSVYITIWSQDFRFHRLDARTGESIWSAVVGSNWVQAPSLGMVGETPAVFAVARRQVYAFSREDGTLLWQWDAPVDLSCRSTFAGGKLYVEAVNSRYVTSQVGDGQTFVFDASMGDLLETLDTSGMGNNISDEMAGRVITQVRDPQGSPCPVMYYIKMRSRNGERYVAAMSVAEPDPAFEPESGLLTLEADPETIDFNSSATVTATYAFGRPGHEEPMAGVVVDFGCDAAANVGSISGGSVMTDEEGRASVVFNSLKRASTVTVSASARFGGARQVTIRIVRGGGGQQPPPTQTGDIAGHIRDAYGRDEKGVSITVKQNNTIVAETTTNAKGDYVVSGLLPGPYRVEAYKNRVGSAWADCEVVAGQTATVNLTLR